MKVFILSLLLLGALLLGIGANFWYINRVADRLKEEVDELPDLSAPDCAAEIGELLQYWEKQTDTVCLSVPYNIVDRVSEQAELLLACADCGDRYGFYAAKALLYDAISDMRRLESFSMGNLL